MSKGFYDSLINGVVGVGKELILNSSRLPEIKECCSLLEEIYEEHNGKKLSINVNLPEQTINFALETHGFVEFEHGDAITKMLECSNKFSMSQETKHSKDGILLEFYVSFKNEGEA